VSGPRIWRPYKRFGDCFEDASLLDDFIKILNRTNKTLIIAESWRDRIHTILLQTLVLENLERVKDLARAHAQHVSASTMRTLCEELKGLLEGGGADD